VLISRRAEDVHQGGLWEFPGGKIEPGEDPQAALERELREELDVIPEAARPLIRVPWDYPDRHVLLDVWRVTRWRGSPHGREGQEIDWVPPGRLPNRAFPAADVPIIAAVRLPACYAISPPPDGPRRDFLRRLKRLTEENELMVQLRAPALDEEAYKALAAECLEVCESNGAMLLLNSRPDVATSVGAHGVHLTGARLRSLATRPLDKRLWVGASCHDAAELARAEELGADFAVLSPVKATPSHPSVTPLGWDGFERLALQARLPVFALAGLGRGDLEEAWRRGAQGVAGIRGFWPGE
jgi:8-oxo-dGTP diphosphatase